MQFSHKNDIESKSICCKYHMKLEQLSAPTASNLHKNTSNAHNAEIEDPPDRKY